MILQTLRCKITVVFYSVATGAAPCAFSVFARAAVRAAIFLFVRQLFSISCQTLLVRAHQDHTQAEGVVNVALDRADQHHLSMLRALVKSLILLPLCMKHRLLLR